MKKAAIWLAGLFLFSQVGYFAYDNLYNNYRRFIRFQCSELKPNMPLDLVRLQRSMIENEVTQVLTSFRVGWVHPGNLPKDFQRLHLDLLAPSDVTELFFYAEGFNRESMRITISDGKISKVDCHVRTRAGS
jgi:hypothetical protein